MTDPDAPLILGVTFGELMTVVVGELHLRLSYDTYGTPEGALVLRSGSSDEGSGSGMSVELATWVLE